MRNHSSHLHYTVRELIRNNILANKMVDPIKMTMIISLSWGCILEVIGFANSWEVVVASFDLLVLSINCFLEFRMFPFLFLTIHTDRVEVEVAGCGYH
jgi:hypothetical protein